MEFRYDEEIGTVIPPEQDCLVLCSMGQVEGTDVTVRKPNPDRDNSDLPEGCHDDVEVVQYRLTSDPKKRITHVLRDKKGEERDKNYYMEEIELHMKQTMKQGGNYRRIIIVYTTTANSYMSISRLQTLT